MTPRDLILKAMHDTEYADMLADILFDTITKSERRDVLRLMIDKGDVKLQAIVADCAVDVVESFDD